NKSVNRPRLVPQRTMTRMIVLCPVRLRHHRILACHPRSTGTNHRIKIDMRRAGIAILRELLSVDLDQQLSIRLRDLHTGSRGVRRWPRASLMDTASNEKSEECGEDRPAKE